MHSGTYALKPSLPAVGGNEGVGEVTEVGSEVQNINTGDHVVLRADQCLGSSSVFSINYQLSNTYCEQYNDTWFLSSGTSPGTDRWVDQ